MKAILDIVKKHKEGVPLGIYSVCSAHPLVIQAALELALTTDTYALIEATSNQVNQDGGYTGMQPADFRELVFTIADKVKLPRDKIILGGDHLGPNCWQSLTAEVAMQKSEILIAEYVKAGFKKIHLDCSMSCSDDPIPLSDETVAGRAAKLCQIAEKAWKETGGEAPVYIIGTEVPVPGGATEELDELEVTSPDAAKQTILAHKTVFDAHGLEAVWPRIVALVVQPGVEFDHHKVIDYQDTKAKELSEFINSQPHMIFEAHSTDYQTENNLSNLVRDHFAILKVGPGVTFALREALWALDQIEQEWLAADQTSNLKATMKKVMKDLPKYWQPYYTSEGQQLELDCQYSLSDRVRYYWPQTQVLNAYKVMSDNFENKSVPLTLLSQYLPLQYQAVRAGEITATVEKIVIHHINAVLKQYLNACRPANV
ncbi:D-tagatose-bisphosphate aldolase, class II, non-catalytic subunit [Pseudocolwellia sp. HL-MZ19]|uniref:D-tagatose-bisphosphate aldolase, class II, non-catalytic subunit n=1 Tax=unclassified Pseudocolwellia TaxID=2848178 RepID=UPI003CE68604